jgi:hypothetical protein
MTWNVSQRSRASAPRFCRGNDPNPLSRSASRLFHDQPGPACAGQNARLPGRHVFAPFPVVAKSTSLTEAGPTPAFVLARVLELAPTSSPLLSGSTDVATAADVTALARMEQSADTGGGRSAPGQVATPSLWVLAPRRNWAMSPRSLKVEYLPPRCPVTRSARRAGPVVRAGAGCGWLWLLRVSLRSGPARQAGPAGDGAAPAARPG